MSKSRKSRFLTTQQPPAAPQQQIQKSKTLDDVLAMEHLVGIEKQLALEKAFCSTDALTIMKATNYLKGIEKKDKVDIKSILVDPLDSSSAFGYKHKPYSLSYDMLRGMAKTPIVAAIIKTRKSQVLNFCEPQADKYSSGFTIEKRNRWRSTVKDKQLTKDEQKRADMLTQFILDCGNSENFWHADTFPTFIGKIVEDSLTFDASCFEVVSDRVGRPIEYFAVDGSTIRLSENFGRDMPAQGQVEINGYSPRYVQVYQGQVYNSFYPWEMCCGLRNPSTDIRTNGYGKAELEDMINLITALLNSDAYNSNFFKVGSAPQGILSYSGNINQSTLDSFRQSWQAQVAGVANVGKIPLINADKVNFTPTHIPNRDMEYSKYSEMLIKTGCAMYTIDPSEVGFPMSGNADGNSGMGGNDIKAKTQYSKDKGLKPLLKHIEHWLNKYIIWRLDPEFEFRFVGIDGQEDKQAELDADIKMVQNFKTLNETRAKYNLPKLDGMDIVLNPIASQANMMAQQGNQDSNNAVDSMQDDPGDQPNPFLKSLHADIGKLLAA